ncbi:MAG: GNAT family N-acetyltransferase [Candidatus Limnocylindria bacterium]
MSATIGPADAIRPAIEGLTLRPSRVDDAAVLSDLFNADNAADGLHWRSTAAELANWLSHASEHFDPGRDLLVLEHQGRVIASSDVEWIDTTDGLREYRTGCSVHPDWRRRGIGRWLLRHNEARAADHARRHPTDRPRVLGCWSGDSAVGRRELFIQEGYAPARYFFDMVRPSLDGAAPLPLPEGLELRPVTADQLRRLWDADVEAFADHWGGFDGSEPRFREWQSDPKFDPSLFVVAWDGDEIAGGVLNEINDAENLAFDRKRGWLASVFVRRPWRRRGLARAVVMQSLVVFRERGLTSAGLGVDADNPHAALRLYEQTGFQVDMRSAAYRKPLALD